MQILLQKQQVITLYSGSPICLDASFAIKITLPNYISIRNYWIYNLRIIDCISIFCKCNNKYNYIRFATSNEINENMPLEINPNPNTISIAI